MVSADKRGNVGTITFATDPAIIVEAAVKGRLSKLGLVVWLPRDEVDHLIG